MIIYIYIYTPRIFSIMTSKLASASGLTTFVILQFTRDENIWLATKISKPAFSNIFPKFLPLKWTILKYIYMDSEF